MLIKIADLFMSSQRRKSSDHQTTDSGPRNATKQEQVCTLVSSPLIFCILLNLIWTLTCSKEL